ncbi:fibronectin type III domain-containing protein-like [Mytilus edulis]|uniref:fibronectin type III domain-containing protein-like n=1 Tax=Mytilus edulis TaxID=6550 RepID=UPI0039F104DE
MTLISIAVLIIYILITDQLTITVKKGKEANAIDGIKELVLECEIDVPCSCIVRSIEWYKDITECSSDPTKYDMNKKVPKLTFKTVDQNVVGYYKCVVDTICTRHISKNMRVFYELPIVTITQKVIEIPTYGTNVELACEIESESNLISVHWYKEKDNSIDSKNREKYVVRDNGLHILTIKDVKKSDIGFYNCVAKNEKGTSKSEPIQVVWASPIVNIQRNIIEIPAYGTNVELACEIESESNLISVQWYKGKESIDSKNREKYVVRDNGLHILTIKDVIKSDIGFYNCVAKNEKGTSKSEPILVMLVTEDQEQQSATLTESMVPTDEDNSYRLFYLSHNVGTKALRRFFNRVHSNLASDLRNPESKAILMDLYKPPRGMRRVLYQGQWDILYPSPG